MLKSTVFFAVLLCLCGSVWGACPMGILSYWQLDETSAGPVIDSLGYVADGTNHGATINQTGKVGKAYEFDGVDDYINISDPNLDASGATKWSFEAWVKSDVITGGEKRIVSQKTATDDCVYKFLILPAHMAYHF